MDHTRKPCAPRARCRRFKHCPICARIRQARFADRAEAAARQMQLPTLYVLVPDDFTPAGMEYARRFFVRQTRPSAGVWTVETGEFRAGFHLNVIAEWCEIEGKFKGHIYREPVRTSVRAVAAYISKASRAATAEEGIARASGDFGHAAHWLKETRHEAPIVAGAQLAHELDPYFCPPSAPGPERDQDTARRWLDRIYAELETKKPRTRSEPTKETND